jgi:hypothetical protein
MTAVTLAQANRIIDAIFKRGAELQCRPLSAIVVEPGCKSAPCPMWARRSPGRG